MPLEHPRKCIIGKISEFALALGRQRVEPAQLVVDKARMAHDDAAVRQAFEKAWEKVGEIETAAEAVSPCEGGVGRNAKRLGAAAESVAEQVEQEAFAIVQPFREWP